MSMDSQPSPLSSPVIQTAPHLYTKDLTALPQETFLYYKVSWQKCSLSLMHSIERIGRDIRAEARVTRMLFRLFRVGKPTRQHMIPNQTV